MRTGLLTWAYPPEKSGLSRAAREIAESLAEDGHDVRVLTLDRVGRSVTGGVEVVGCAPGRVAKAMRRIVAFGHLAAPFSFARAIMREHRRRPFDVIESTNWYAPGLFVALAGRVPLVVRNSTPAATTIGPVRRPRDRLDAAAARFLERVAARRASALISNTAAHAAKIAALYGVRAEGAGHIVAGLSLPPEIVARGAAATYPEAASPLRLLFVGRAEPRKGFDALLDAIAILADEGIAFRILLVGVNEADVARLPRAARARVQVRHRVPEEALHVAFERAHVVVAPSRYESFGLVYQEALAFGRPIVACAEDASARQFVGDAGAGLLAPSCSGRAVADAVAMLASDPALRWRLAEASRRASGRFDRRSLAAETVALYATVLGGPR